MRSIKSKNTVIKSASYVIFSFLLSMGFVELGQELGNLLFYRLIPTSNSDVMTTASVYLCFIGIWIVTIVYCLIVKSNKPILKAMTKQAKGNNFATSLILGLVFGMGLNLMVAFTAMLNGDIHLSFSNFNILYFIFVLIAVGIQSGAEELVNRLFLFQRLKKIFPDKIWIPVVGNALFFAALHVFNPGATFLSTLNIFLVGVLYSEMVAFFDCFWATVVAHTSWNFTQAILLGLPNSGIVLPYSVFKLDAANARNSIAYNVQFGIEGTILTDLIFIVGIVALYVYHSKKSIIPLDVWNCSPEEAD